MLREFEMLREEFGHFAALLSAQLLVLEHPSDVCYPERCASNEYQRRRPVGFRFLSQSSVKGRQGCNDCT